MGWKQVSSGLQRNFLLCYLSMLEFLTHSGRWIIEVFVVVLATLSVDLIQNRVIRRLHSRLETTNHFWDDILTGAIVRPLSLLIWVVGLSFAGEIAARETDTQIFSLIQPLRTIGIIGSITWFFLRFVKRAEEAFLNTKKSDPTTAEAVSKVLRASIFITAGLVALQSLGFSISGVLAFGGIGGLAIGFAAKDLLSNFFGGLMLYLDRPFAVGDWINSPDREIEGTVEHIGWRLTRIRTFDKRPLYVPNSVFANISVINPSRMSNRRIKETIGVRYTDASKLPQLLQAVREMLLSHPEIDTKQTLMVNFDSFGPSSLDFFIYTFTKTTVWTKFHEIKEDVLLKIHNLIEAHGAEVAFPTSTLHIAEVSEGELPAMALSHSAKNAPIPSES